MRMVRLLIALFVVVVAQQCHGKVVEVEGKLFCGDKAASGVTVKLVDEDWASGDDVLDEKETGRDGSFHLKGDEDDLDPHVKIYHSCGQSFSFFRCDKKWEFTIPDKYVYSGTHVKKVFQMGSLNLEMEPHEEKNDCIHRRRHHHKH